MTPSQAETKVAELFSKYNAFATILKKGIDGNQPFDLVTIDSQYTSCLDVKLCKKDYFPFSRVEDNQKSAFEYLHKLYNPNLILGFAIVYDNNVYLLKYSLYKELVKTSVKSVKPSELDILGQITL